jgi:hypothetical protein
VNAASTVVAALISTKAITNVEDAVAELEGIRDVLFVDLEKLVDSDNAVFEKAEASAPKRTAGARTTGSKNGGAKGGGKNITADSARELELTWGKFKGVTLGELETMSEEDAEEYGYDKDGLGYLKYLSRNDSNDFVATRAKAILKDRRAGSDEDDE